MQGGVVLGAGEGGGVALDGDDAAPAPAGWVFWVRLQREADRVVANPREQVHDRGLVRVREDAVDVVGDLAFGGLAGMHHTYPSRGAGGGGSREHLHGHRLGRHAEPGIVGHVDTLVVVGEYSVALLPVPVWSHTMMSKQILRLYRF